MHRGAAASHTKLKQPKTRSNVAVPLLMNERGQNFVFQMLEVYRTRLAGCI